MRTSDLDSNRVLPLVSEAQWVTGVVAVVVVVANGADVSSGVRGRIHLLARRANERKQPNC